MSSAELVAEIHRNRGVAFGQLGRKEEALHEFRLAAKLAGSDAKTQYNLGVAYEELGHDWYALEAYRKAVGLDPQMEMAWGNLGMAAYRTERFAEAHAALETAQEIDPRYFDARPEQRQAWEDTMAKQQQQSVTQNIRHEVNLRLTPSFGAIVGLDQTISPYINKYSPIMLDSEVDVQIYRYLHGFGSFLYGRTIGTSIPSGQNMSTSIYGLGFGLKLVSHDDISEPFTTFMDRARFFAMAGAGPYFSTGSITLTAANLATGATTTEASLGLIAGTGFEYFFNKNFGLGFNVKLHYVNLSLDNYFLFTLGPSVVGRF